MNNIYICSDITCKRHNQDTGCFGQHYHVHDEDDNYVSIKTGETHDHACSHKCVKVDKPIYDITEPTILIGSTVKVTEGGSN